MAVRIRLLVSGGSTGAALGACASFLYKLRHGIEDIRSGRSRVAFIGSAEAPVNPEVMEGYAATGALAADKSYIGHSLGSASGDQVVSTLGVWKHGLIPGIQTIDAMADDVFQERLQLSPEHRGIDPESLHYTIVNSKGFGGNNATGTMLRPTVSRKMMQARYSAWEWKAREKANQAVRERQQKYDDDMIAGTDMPVYKFDHGVLGDDGVEMAENAMPIAGKRVRLDLETRYDDMKVN